MTPDETVRTQVFKTRTKELQQQTMALINKIFWLASIFEFAFIFLFFII